jgi:hypothetical protein
MQLIEMSKAPVSEREHMDWLAALAERGAAQVTWDPRFKLFLADVFSGESRLQMWDHTPLTEVIVEFLASSPEKPRLELGRYAVFSGAPKYGRGSRGLLWVNCISPGTPAIFAALIRQRHVLYCLDLYLSRSLAIPSLPPQFLSALHLWLRSHQAGHIVSIDLHNASGYLFSLDPAHCGLEQDSIKPLRRFRAPGGAA